MANSKFFKNKVLQNVYIPFKNQKKENNSIMEKISVDSLWLIPQRDKTGKHKNIYHGNFIQQIHNQYFKKHIS